MLEQHVQHPSNAPLFNLFDIGLLGRTIIPTNLSAGSKAATMNILMETSLNNQMGILTLMLGLMFLHRT
jgi:hypothetical protein